MTKPKRPPTNAEFNAAVLDRVIAQAMPADQKGDEFTPADLVARGMTDGSARRFCTQEWKRGALSRRVGMSRLTRRRTWIYKVREGK
ncbi:hypothetical protein UFOVP505_34 [uncultured Caudovirales phage]|uniref:Uncharacterized protein n=1 Tax=uncultured Caudovirales phage TaxID=2100421 RepID=A0A6J5MPD4_9CAUD|nr:hypothetical protein UFOVP505_34 [uncultured Caudovirales phage]